MPFRRFFILAVFFASVAAGGVARAALKDDVDSALADRFAQKCTTGIRIIRLGESADASTVVYEHNSDTPLTPASNLKLVTTAAALDGLGADFKFQTALALKGDEVAIVGDGDPSMGDAEMLKKVNWTTTSVFQSWAGVLQKRGLTKVARVRVDDSVFDDEFFHPNWPLDQEHKRYEAQVAGLNLNANCLDFYLKTQGPGQVVAYTTDPQTDYASVTNRCTLGSENAVWLSRTRGGNDVILRGQTRGDTGPIPVTIDDPPLFAGTVLAESLDRAGLAVADHKPARDRTIRGSLVKPDASAGWTVVAVHETPIELVIARANKDSMNLFAEALCKRLGFAKTKEPGSWKNGTAAVGAFLRSLDVPAEAFKLDDGCGLSKENKISPAAIATVLQHEYFSENRDLYLRTLSVAGQDGTLDNRFPGSSLQGRVFGKSGYVDGVSTLSGFIKRADGSLYIFSIMMNDVPRGANGQAKAVQERVVKAIDDNG